jgi:hypothetical protein
VPLSSRLGTGCLLIALTALPACSARLPPQPTVFTQSREQLVDGDRSLHLELVKPVGSKHPGILILFATGDGGWGGVSKDAFRHMAEDGFAVAAFDSREALQSVKRTGGKVSLERAGERMASIIDEARQRLALPASTRVILTGNSRGAGLVAFGAGEPRLQRDVKGAIAIALTREGDYVRAPGIAERSSSLQVDDEGRLQTYPALGRLGSIKIAVIQSTGDSYVTADEARTLLGPDTTTRRLYVVQARNHGFAGGRDELLADLDHALDWITATPLDR